MPMKVKQKIFLCFNENIFCTLWSQEDLVMHDRGCQGEKEKFVYIDISASKNIDFGNKQPCCCRDDYCAIDSFFSLNDFYSFYLPFFCSKKRPNQKKMQWPAIVWESNVNPLHNVTAEECFFDTFNDD